MDILEVFETLYGDDASDTISLINRSDNTFLHEYVFIHTGFTFKSQDKSYELFYDIYLGSLIKQIKSDKLEVPRAGIKYIRNENQLQCSNILVAKIYSDNEVSMEIQYKSQDDIRRRKFQVIERDLNNNFIKNHFFSINKEFETELFCVNGRFQESRPVPVSKNARGRSSINETIRAADDELKTWDDDFPGWQWGRE